MGTLPGFRSLPICLLLCSIVCFRLASLQEPQSNDNEAPDSSPSQSAQVEYSTPNVESQYIYEHFDSQNLFSTKWIKSSTNKADSTELKYDGEWTIVEIQAPLKGDFALMTKSKARHHAYSAKLDKPFKFNSKPFILQYEVQFRNGQECGGAYIKLLAAPSGDLNKLNDKSKYSIMFGPDKCGNENKLHFIFNHKNPKNGSVTEKHWKKSSSVTKLDEVFKDNQWHQFRLEIYPDNSFQVSVDKHYAQKGLILEDFKPPVNPPKTIDDPKDSKPEDWDEREKIPDPDAVKPNDWDETQPRKISDPNAAKPENWDENEPEMIPDPEAKQPTDWDIEMDGEWEAPLISNPKCVSLSGCGKWSAPLIDNPKYKGKWKSPLIVNPAYKGKWAPRKIPNPDFYEDLNPFKTMASIDAVAFELWTISDNIAFDNVLITDDIEVANYVSSLTYDVKKEISDQETDNIMVKAMKYANKNPWMWAVYLFAIGIPVVLFIAFCCVSPGKKTEPKDEAYDPAQAKKTDYSAPDVVPENLTEESIEEEEPLIEEIEDDGEETEENVDVEESEELEEEVPSKAVRSSPRHRKPRKE